MSESTPETPVSLPMLFATKLVPPPSRPGRVRRERLLARLEAGLQPGTRLIVLSAPAGFGKTSLLTDWLEQKRPGEELRFGWLSLEEDDGDPARFLAYLMAMVKSVLPGQEENLPAAQGPAGAKPETLLMALVNALGTVMGRMVLVLDDYHLVQSQTVHNLLQAFLDHLPAQVTLVIASRADPPLPLARMRARNQLIEIRVDDLRFTPQEARDFLRDSLGLQEAAIAESAAALTGRTEGWAAGLQMAGLALLSHAQDTREIAQFLRDFDGSQRYILDYLVEEVLAHLPETVQEFLLQTSMLERLSAELCAAVVGSVVHSARQQLEYLEKSNLFIVPLDDRRTWYRYHHLFADLLRHRLAQMQPNLLPELHLRASGWYEQQKEYAQAIGHAFQSGSKERAAGLIEQTAEETLLRGENTTFQGWMQALDAEQMQAHATLYFYLAWTQFMAGKHPDPPLESLEELQDRLPPGWMAVLRAYQVFIANDIRQAMLLAQQAIEQVEERYRFVRGLAVMIMDALRTRAADMPTRAEIFSRLAAQGEASGNVMTRTLALCHLAEVRLRQGQLPLAKTIYEETLSLVGTLAKETLPVAGEAMLGLGKLYYEWNDLETAQHWLREGIDRLKEYREVSSAEGWLILARLCAQRGDQQAAYAALEEAKAVVKRLDIIDYGLAIIDMYQVETEIRLGERKNAPGWLRKYGWIDEAGKAGVPALTPGHTMVQERQQKYEQTIAARALLAIERPADALLLLNNLRPWLQKDGRTGMVIENLVMSSAACWRLKQPNEAQTMLAEAITLAGPGGYVRSFLDEGRVVLEVLEELVEEGEATLSESRRAYLERLLSAFGGKTPAVGEQIITPPLPQLGETSAAQAIAGKLVEELSDRELAVLRLLPSSLSTPEIADQLYVAASTVRTHIKSIYGKLGVHRRMDAIARARELGLLKN